MIWSDVAVIERCVRLRCPVRVTPVQVGTNLGQELEFRWLCLIITPSAPQKINKFKSRKTLTAASYLTHSYSELLTISQFYMLASI